MADARKRFTAMMQEQFQTAALDVIGVLDEQLDALKARVLADLKALKSGEATLDQLKITDNDYELMPAKPKIERVSA